MINNSCHTIVPTTQENPEIPVVSKNTTQCHWHHVLYVMYLKHRSFFQLWNSLSLILMPLYDLRKQTISSVRRSAGAHIVDSVRLALNQWNKAVKTLRPLEKNKKWRLLLGANYVTNILILPQIMIFPKPNQIILSPKLNKTVIMLTICLLWLPWQWISPNCWYHDTGGPLTKITWCPHIK